MQQLVCAVDLGSTMVKASLVDQRGRIVARGRVAAPAISGDHGELDAEQCFGAATRAIRQAVEEQADHAGAVCGLALSSQRATCVPIGADDRPLGPALSWQGVGCDPAARRFYAELGAERFVELTGLHPAPIYTVAKLAHLRVAEPTRFGAVTRFVLLHDYVLRRLGADDYYTDPSNGSASGLMRLSERRWCPEILAALGLDEGRLPALVPGGAAAGRLSDEAARATGLGTGTPLFVGGGDQQCAALGAGATEPGDCALSLGTAGVVLCPVDRGDARAAPGLLCTAHLPRERWLIEGFHSSFGSSFGWAGTLLGCSSFAELERLAAAAPAGAGGLLYLPFLAGIGTPEFDGAVRGAVLGATPTHEPEQLARAVLEGVALETRRIVEQVEQRVPLRRIRTNGGGAGGDLVPQLLADHLGRELELLGDVEGALLGAAAIAWAGSGAFAGVTAATRAVAGRSTRAIVHPTAERAALDDQYRRYRAAVEAVRGFHRRVGAAATEVDLG